jgi:hypothetical protein
MNRPPADIRPPNYIPTTRSSKRIPRALELTSDEAAALTPEKVLAGNDGWKP